MAVIENVVCMIGSFFVKVVIKNVVAWLEAFCCVFCLIKSIVIRTRPNLVVESEKS